MRRALCRCLAAGVLTGCATNPATGNREISLVSEAQEISIGDQTVAAARASIGIYPDSALQRYVHALGARLAATTERPALPWNFEVVDDPEVNAFGQDNFGASDFESQPQVTYWTARVNLSF